MAAKEWFLNILLNLVPRSFILQQKKPGLFGEMTDSRMEAGNIHNELGVSCVPESKEMFKTYTLPPPPQHTMMGI